MTTFLRRTHAQIILMLADDMPCNARNSFPGEVFNDASHSLNL
jgi:phosphatidylinositol glycan class K